MEQREGKRDDPAEDESFGAANAALKEFRRWKSKTLEAHDLIDRADKAEKESFDQRHDDVITTALKPAERSYSRRGWLGSGIFAQVKLRTKSGPAQAPGPG